MIRRRNRPVFDNIQFDSDGELEFYHWANTLNLDFEFQPSSIELLPTVKIGGKTLFRNLSYTPDFIVKNIPDTILDTIGWCVSPDRNIYIDIKGQSVKQTGGKIRYKFVSNPDSVKFSIIQKITYDKHRIIINKVGIPELFNLTFCPEACRYTKTGKPRKWYSTCRSVKEYKKGI